MSGTSKVTVLSLKKLLEDYIRQEYFSSKCILAVISCKGILDKGRGSELELIFTGLSIEEFSNSFIVEADNLEQLKEWCQYLSETFGTDLEFIAQAYGVEIGTHLYLDTKVNEEFLKLHKSPIFIEIQRTSSKIPVLGVGGGAMSNIFCCRYVLNSKKRLKRAVFMRHTGDLCNNKSQALVPVQLGDFVIEVQGSKPFDANNPSLTIKVNRVVVIGETKLECEDVSEMFNSTFIPRRVVEGAHTYHNRNGSYFCLDVKVKKPKETENMQENVSSNDQEDTPDEPIETMEGGCS